VTTTLQQVQDRAIAWSAANGLTSLTADRALIINRIAADERALFDLATRENRFFFATAVAVISTSGASGRSIPTASLNPPVGRILKLELAGVADPIAQVDPQDTGGEFAPRFYLLGTTIYEVSNDWSASNGTVSGTLTYTKLPAALPTTGDLTQSITLPDEFSDILELRLARYLAHIDVGREDSELEQLDARIEEREADFVSHISKFGGVEAMRFKIPTNGDKK
jgi:hypothetical protein